MTDTTTQDVQTGNTDTTVDNQANGAVLDGTVLDGADAGAAAAAPQDWPDNWRQRMAGEDANLLKQLERLSSPQDLYKSYRALQSKLSTGEYKKVTALPDNATPEQVAAYRKDNGIPEKWEDYDTSLPDGLVIGEEDKPIVDAVLQDLHAAHAPPPFVKAALSSYFKMQEQHQAAAVEADNNISAQTVESLRAEWGAEYARNKNAISAYLDTLGDFGEKLIGARLADGTKLLGSVEGVKFIHNLAKEVNPAVTAFPGSADPMKSIEQELADLKVGTDEYWRSPAKQARARELYALQEKFAAKKA